MNPSERNTPGYILLHETGELRKRVAVARDRLQNCRICPRRCGVDRSAGGPGKCRVGAAARVASYSPHFGEERPLVGRRGSGTIFFAGCGLLCIFCQNYEISHLVQGREADDGRLAAMMLELQNKGCCNINLVTPSHVVPQILAALAVAVPQGLAIPLVHNSSGYDTLDTLALLDGIVDIYLPDFKFWSRETANRLAKAPDYPVRARQAVKEMHRQVGELVINRKGIATRGLLVRHLVMPGLLEETRAIMGFLAGEINTATYVNLMGQYQPCGTAARFPPLDRCLDHEEYEEALRLAKEAGLTRLDTRRWDRLYHWLGF